MALLEATAITKSFAGVQALRGVSFSLRAGEVHALLGENGAGKSTLIKVITGAEKADSGTLTVDGSLVAHNSPAAARALGIAAVYQQPALFPDLTVAENIALALESRGAVAHGSTGSARGAQARELLERAGAEIAPERTVSTLSMPEQQMVEIAKAIGAHARILILDEPTASLTDREVERLFRVIGALRGEGAGIIYISHRLEEIAAIADRVTVLRDGQTIATRDLCDVDRARTDAADGGARHPRDLSEARRADRRRLRWRCASSAAARRASAMSRSRCGAARYWGSRDWSARAGRELAETLFGLTPADGGEILLRGKPVRDRVAGGGDPHEDRLCAGGPAAARRGAGDADRRQHQPGQSGRGLAARPDR